MQKKRVLIACKNNLFKPFKLSSFDQNNSFLSVKFKVQLRSSRYCLHQPVSESLMQSSFARFNNRRGLTVEVECDSAVSEEFIRFYTCELIMCGITALEVQGPDVLLTTGKGFAVLFFSEMVHESCRCSSSSASS